MVTLAQVAVLAQVSTTTVSRVLSDDPGLSVPELTRQRVEDAAHTLDYQPRARRGPAHAHRGGRGRSVLHTAAVVYSFSPEEETRDPYYSAIRLGLEREAHQQGIILHTVPFQRGTGLRLPDEPYLIAVGRVAIDATVASMSAKQVLITVDDEPAGGGVDSVTVDLAAATRTVLDHLLTRGHRRIGFIGGAADGLVDARQAEFERYMSAHGLLDASCVLIGQWSPESPQSGYDLMAQAIERDLRCSAYFIASDPLAAAAMKALADRGIGVPADVAIIGFDDNPVSAWLHPALTTVAVPSAQMGRSAIDLLRQRQEGRKVPLKIIVPTTLIIRDSSGPKDPPNTPAGGRR
jgi:LacI family transcriptional regulator